MLAILMCWGGGGTGMFFYEKVSNVYVYNASALRIYKYMVNQNIPQTKVESRQQGWGLSTRVHSFLFFVKKRIRYLLPAACAANTNTTIAESNIHKYTAHNIRRHKHKYLIHKTPRPRAPRISARARALECGCRSRPPFK